MGLAAFNRRRRELAQQQETERRASERAPSNALEAMTVAELRRLAAERGIDLGDAKRKVDIVAAIRAHEQGDAGAATESGEGTGEA